MLARRLRVLIAGLLVAFGAAAWLAGVRNPVAIAACALGGLLLLVAATVAGSCAIAGVHRGWLAECAATARTYLVRMPFLAGSALPQPGAGAPPVLLVHGYVCNRGAFLPMARRLARAGFAPYLHDLEPVYAGIDDYADGLARRIDEVLAASGAAKLAVVCHSMGGLALRACLRKYGGGKVARLVTLGTPHHGTRLARLGLGTNARQMEPGSAWLQELAATPPGVPVVAIWTRDDNIVAPQESACLEGAENIVLEGIGHVALLESEAVFERVVASLRAAPGL